MRIGGSRYAEGVTPQLRRWLGRHLEKFAVQSIGLEDLLFRCDLTGGADDGAGDIVEAGRQRRGQQARRFDAFDIGFAIAELGDVGDVLDRLHGVFLRHRIICRERETADPAHDFLLLE